MSNLFLVFSSSFISLLLSSLPSLQALEMPLKSLHEEHRCNRGQLLGDQAGYRHIE